MTELPERPWDIVEMDFCGPFPNGEYALVMTDQYSRCPEVEFVRSTSNRPVQKKLKKIFSTYGVPKRVQTDNGPPFNSSEFQRFADVTGFQHKKITPRHPKA
jgi:transposase InsO family protein